MGRSGVAPTMVVDDHDPAGGRHVPRRRLEVGLSPLDVMNDIVEEGHIDV